MVASGGKVYLVGAGPGDPGLITVRGRECLYRAQVVVFDRLLHPSLFREFPAEAEGIDVGKAPGQDGLAQEEINQILIECAHRGLRVVRLKGGDPFLFGRGGEEAEALAAAGVPFEVVPGVTSALAVPAYAGIPVTHRVHSSSVAILPGREDPTRPESRVRWEHLVPGADTLVILMGMGRLAQLVEQLQQQGLSPQTPVALIRWGTTPQQETLVGSLDDIIPKAQQAGFSAPVVIVVGEVVRLRERLAWYEGRPLFGKRVLVTRSRAQASELVALLREYGAEPVEFPTIQILPPLSFAPLDRALQRLADFQWLLFTSANGVRMVWERLWQQGRDGRALAGAKLAAVGPATAQELHQRGLRPEVVPSRFTTAALLQALPDLAGQRVLLPRADLADEGLAQGLRDRGAVVEEVVAYRTVAGDAMAAEELRERLAQGEIDVVTFTSSSTVTNLVRALGREAQQLLQGARVACIGPVTAQRAQELGLRVDIVAQEHTIPGLVAALVVHFQQQLLQEAKP